MSVPAPFIRLSLLSVALLLVACSGSRQLPASPPAAATSKTDPRKQQEAYEAKPNRIWDLVHTRLELQPQWGSREIDGKATLFLHPHFYPTDSLVLDAKMMLVKQVGRIRAQGDTLLIPFRYDSSTIRLKLDTVFHRDNELVLWIDYTGRPDLRTGDGSRAIRGEKGLYFINPDGKDPNKPTQLWSQGETAHNSVWFPTLDVPNQKMTQEIYLTVDTSFVTLSNGLLLSQQLNGNGTRTDYWKQSLPTPPYLTMIGVGRWSVTRERWNNIELSYYTDPAYAPYARRIFGKTAEMLDFFSEKLGYPFVWEKYAQVCVHEYISGAMENATAVVHGTGIQQDPRQQLDYDYEDVIAHELIHHWFGDLVTCASWSNVVLNEGFANYGEYLWREHAYGSDDADRLNTEDLSSYLAATSKSDPPAVRYRYEDAEDLFDAVSYNKGGRILHLLRRQIGDDAFFASLKLYLQRHAFGNAEVDDFRQAVEEVTGEDLHWFFDQWYFRPGRPILNVDYAWDESARTMSVMLEQQQSMEEHAPYRLPMLIDVYTVNGRKSVPVDFNSAKQTIRIPLEQAPELVNVDADKRILCTRRDNKPKEWLPYQYAHGPRYYDRWEAVSKLSENYEVGSAGGKTIFSALQDPYWRIRKKAVESIGSWMQSRADTALPAVKRLATGDPESAVRSEAWRSLRRFAEYDDYAELVPSGLRDSSYEVCAKVFELLKEKDPTLAAQQAPQLENDSGNAILEVMAAYFATDEQSDRIGWYTRALRQAKGYTRYGIVNNFGKYLSAQHDPDRQRQGADQLEQLARNATGRYFRSAAVSALRSLKSTVESRTNTLDKELNQLPVTNTPQIERSRKERDRNEHRELLDRLERMLAELDATRP